MQVIKVTPNQKGEIIVRLFGTDYLIDVQKLVKQPKAVKPTTEQE